MTENITRLYFDDIWETYHCDIRSFINSRTHNHMLTDDILQDVFIKVYTKLHTINDRDKIKPWIFQIARNRIVDYFRQQKRFQSIDRFLLPYEMEFEPEANKRI